MAGIDWERRAALLLGLAGLTAAVGLGRAPLAQQAATDQRTGAAGRPDARQTVEAFIAKYLDVYNRKDAARVAALYTEDGILVPPGPITSGRQNIEQAWRAVFDASRTGLRYDIQQAQAEGNLVWSVGRFTAMAPDESGVPRERQGNIRWESEELRFGVHAFNFLPSPRPR